MTDIVPLDKAGVAADPGAGQTTRTLMPISVNLLPEEVVRARTGASARRITVIALVVVAALMGAWYFQAHQAASDSQDSLDRATAQTATAKREQLKYSGVTNTKLQIQTVGGQLRQVTAGDVDWAKVVGRIRAQTPTGLTLTGITGTAAADQQTPNAGDAPGTLVITGNSPSEAGVHQFADRLAALPELYSTFVTSVAAKDDTAGFTFSISVAVNKKALNTRYAKAGTR